MRVLFLNPPFHPRYSRSQRSPAVTKSGTLYWPAWLAHAAGVLIEDGFEVDLIDAPASGKSLEQLRERIVGFDPRLVVLDTSTPSIYNDIAVAKTIKSWLPECTVMLVGTHASALPEDTMQSSLSIDLIAIGEYDHTVRDVARMLRDKGNESDWSMVPGLCYREGRNLQRSKPRGLIEDLDSLPMVSVTYKRFLDMYDYFNPNALYPMVTIMSGRGCPNRCTFCLYPQTMTGRRLRLRSSQNVVAEMAYIKENFSGVKSIFFEDDTLTADRDWLHQTCRLIMQEKIGIPWTANARIDMDLESLEVMKRAGCRLLCVGFESGNQQLLDNVNKGTTLEMMESFAKRAKSAGIMIHGCFMAGLPGETRETLQQTLQLALRLKPDTAQFFPIMVYPGTEAYRWYEERGYLSTTDFSKWVTKGGLHNSVVNTEALSARDLVQWCDYARRCFYLRPAYLIYKGWQVIRSPNELRRNLRAAKKLVRYLIRGSDV